MDLLAEMLACETREWQALVEGDAATDKAALSDDFLGVYPSGFSDRAGHVGQLANGPTMQAYDLSEARVMQLGRTRALLAYRARYRLVGQDSWNVMFISSIWEQRSGVWVNTFSQDTPEA